MKKFKKYAASKAGRDTLLSFGIVIAGYIYLQVMVATGNISSLLESLLVPICAYVIMAVSLNLTVGIPVSYTHLDVYKRQVLCGAGFFLFQHR